MTVLVKFEQARQALIEAKTVDEVKDIRDKAEALRLYLKQQGESLEMQNYCAEIKVRAERRAGELLADNGFGHNGGDRKSDNTMLSDFGVTPMQSFRFRTIARLPKDSFEEYIAETKAAKEELTSAGMLRLAKNGQPDVTRINAVSNNEWFTPKVYLDAVYQVLGWIDIDPASNPLANETVKAKAFYTQDDNGLDYDWPGKVWLNPPYGGDAAEFTAKLIQQFAAGITTEAIAVVNSNVTETKWFAPLWDYTLCFTNHRINFYSPIGTPNGSTHGSVFIYLGKQVTRFVEAFRPFGVTVSRIDK